MVSKNEIRFSVATDLLLLRVRSSPTRTERRGTRSRCRFADFTFPDGTAKFVTVQHLGKLFPIFTELTADATERSLRASVGNDDDAKAILKRCMFVEVRDQLVEPRLRAAQRDETRSSKGKLPRGAAKSLRQEGDANKLRSVLPET